ncbi:hypothetical protein ACGFNX_19850 [Streptomyces sp. NPDC048723]|uniref:hypothetical protein n=1 Tax=Streptomyces sp. NPDC048723 TaxID=3365589 RepID=UPI00371118F9
MPTKPRPHGRGHVPVAVYSCAPDLAVRTEAEGLGRRYATARHWLVATVRSDDDPSMPLDDRLGWSAIRQALASGFVRGVVVAEAKHVADNSREFHRLGVAVREKGAFLAEATDGRPLHTRLDESPVGTE